MSKLFGLLVLIIPGILLVAFGPRAGDEVPRDRVVVEYWEKWTGAEEQQMRQIVTDFNNSVGREKNIYVRYMSTTAINQKTLVATAGGVPPDVAGLWEHNVVQYAAQDALEPLENLAAAAGIRQGDYKKVYWDQLNYKGHLYALISTPAAVVLHYNRLIFESDADALRAHGLDPKRAPRSIAELDAYADALTRRDAHGRILRAGYFPMEPNWYVPQIWMWFDGQIFDDKTQKFTLTDPKVVQAYDWIASYTRKFGKDAANDFRGGLSTAFDSPQNAFLVNFVCMEQQGPWMANYIDHLRPDLQRLLWPREVEMTKPIAERRKNYFWAVAPFPDIDGHDDVTYASCDVLTIPRGAKHKKEAFEFIAYVQRQEEMEKLCMMHSKNSPLANVSSNFLEHHPNPYIEVFEKMASSPHALGTPQIAIWQEVEDELTAIGQAMALGDGDAQSALARAQVRLQLSYDNYMSIQRARLASAK
jgi:ABC-type glycerol-3-phosphate transport system substrate-binding protein